MGGSPRSTPMCPASFGGGGGGGAHGLLHAVREWFGAPATMVQRADGYHLELLSHAAPSHLNSSYTTTRISQHCKRRAAAMAHLVVPLGQRQ